MKLTKIILLLVLSITLIASAIATDGRFNVTGPLGEYRIYDNISILVSIDADDPSFPGYVGPSHPFNGTINFSYVTGMLNDSITDITFQDSEFQATGGPTKEYKAWYNLSFTTGGTFQLNASLYGDSIAFNISNSSTYSVYVDGSIIEYTLNTPEQLYYNESQIIYLNVTNTGNTPSSNNVGNVSFKYNDTHFTLSSPEIYSGSSWESINTTSEIQSGFNFTYYDYNSTIAVNELIQFRFTINSSLADADDSTKTLTTKVGTTENAPTSIKRRLARNDSMEVISIINSTVGPLSIEENQSVEFNLSATVNSNGNTDLSSVTLTAYLNTTSVGTTTVSLSESTPTIINFTVNFDTLRLAEAGYNFSVYMTHSSAENKNDSKLIQINFTTFSDNDNDGRYPTAYDGTDCNDNSGIIYPGASCEVEGYIGSSYDSSCTCQPGRKPSSGGSGGGLPPATKVTTEGNHFDLSKNQKVRLAINGKSHSVQIKDLTETTATIIVQSEPQEFTLSIGDSVEVDVDEDNSKDIKVTLNGIANQKADLTVELIEKSTSSIEEEDEVTSVDKKDVPTDSIEIPTEETLDENLTQSSGLNETTDENTAGAGITGAVIGDIAKNINKNMILAALILIVALFGITLIIRNEIKRRKRPDYIIK